MASGKIVSYIRGSPAESSIPQQKSLIARYCQKYGVVCDEMFVDKEQHNRHSSEIGRAQELGISDSKWIQVLPSWERMMTQVKEGMVSTILVDTKYRLFGASCQQRALFERLMKDKGLSIIEVALEPLPVKEGCSAAIYHSTQSSKARPIIMLKQLDALYVMAGRMGLTVGCVLIDDVMYRRENYPYLLDYIRNGLVDMVILASAYHLGRNMNTMYNLLNEFQSKHTMLISQKEGHLNVVPGDGYKGKNLRVAVYGRIQGPADKESQTLLLSRMKLYIRTRTNWELTGVYIATDADKDNIMFDQLYRDRQLFDLLMIDNLGVLDNYVSTFIKKWSMLSKDIYCIRNEVVFCRRQSDL